MRGIQLTEYVKGPSELKVSDLPDPEPQSTEYLISVRAAGLNFFDNLQIAGKYQSQPAFPWVSGSEFAGVVLAVPTEGTVPPRFKVGDKVFGSAQGAYATKICAPEQNLLPIPEGWDYVSAAGLFVTVPTSYAGLVVRAKVQPGEWVLVHAAAGGVGLAAVMIAKALGAKVIATAGSAEKLEIAKRFGADHGVNYNDKSWTEQVKTITDGHGVDVVYDPVGKINDSLKIAAWNSRILVIGFAGGAIESVKMNRVLLKNTSLIGLFWGMYLYKEPQTPPEVWKGIFDMIAKGQFKPTTYTDKVFAGLESIPAGLQALGARGTWGKVSVSIPEEGSSKL